MKIKPNPNPYFALSLLGTEVYFFNSRYNPMVSTYAFYYRSRGHYKAKMAITYWHRHGKLLPEFMLKKCARKTLWELKEAGATLHAAPPELPDGYAAGALSVIYGHEIPKRFLDRRSNNRPPVDFDPRKFFFPEEFPAETEEK